ncbi:TaqI-like C-terminal specificity domain-containing protein [Aliarcobacter skirrowii]|uniref:Eco57I restriction-modification methylase domain-containing protein n=1 Tax=Aliarcobacter skirrowii TaxID=28200 RepID=UPI0029B06385|nr:DNA methyltransferase [Aliarcobacter skirrowii]MDX4067683.1 TaqI-like C-terminal specificity domain-containing protein [Aliarcobacter skirrowii]
MSIFQNSVLKTFKQDEKLVALRWAAFQNYKAKVEAIKDFKEEEYQDGFLKDIFESCLGYTLKTTNPSSFNLEREKKNETDSKKADGVIYLNSEIIAVIELKDTKTKNLDRVQQQAFWYLTQHTKAKYVIISNFDELRFYFDKSTAYESFSLFNLSYDEFCKLHLLLSFENIKDETALKIKEKSNSFEQDISKKLYKDFSNFRTLLFENIVKNNYDESKTLIVQKFDKQTLLRLTQKLCDRIIFILFAEDRDLLRANMIKEIREEFINQKFTNYSLYDIYKFYFEAINKGNDKLQIPQYNGGLFAVDELLDSLIIDDFILDENVQILSNYDFASEISVNILGHIFEQSLTDLEELQANIDNVNFDKTKSKRKKDGVFYTPEYITRYIVENTLGKMCSEKREELLIGNGILIPSNPKKLTKQEQQTKDNLQEYKKWLLNLKILDPACGSGAFLNQALEYLISEHKNLQNDLALMGDLFASYMVEEEILENNLYGVDINEDAVEIAKLSLWLRTAKRGRPLTKLVDKIKCGNSLIDDKNVVANAFVWQEEFKEVFENGGFDVVIGNPPYVVTKKEDYKNYIWNTDLYLMFFELCLKKNILNEKYIFSFITPKFFLVNKTNKDFREYLLTKVNLYKLVETSPFEDVVSENIISFISSEKEISKEISIFNDIKSEIKYINSVDKKYCLSNENFEILTFLTKKQIELLNKISFNTINLSKISSSKRGMEIGKKDLFEDDAKIECLIGQDVQKYSILLTNSKVNSSNKEYLRLKDFFNNKLIYLRRVSPILIASIFDKDIAFNKNIYGISIIDSFDIKYILVLINSKLLDFYYKTKFSTKKEDVFPEIQTYLFNQLPIKEISLKEQEPFIQKADLMLELNKKLQELKQNFINELNLEKVPTKLQKFEELDFDNFVKEYAKSKKLKFADKLEERNFKNEWQRLFENDKKEVLEIQNQINITDKEIDQMVYKLYDLTQYEIKIVEGE